MLDASSGLRTTGTSNSPEADTPVRRLLGEMHAGVHQKPAAAPLREALSW
jgi:hypothetical protein